MKTFALKHKFASNITRSVDDMAAFFAYKRTLSSSLELDISLEEDNVWAVLHNTEKQWNDFVQIESSTSGEFNRAVKLAVFSVFCKLTGKKPKFPWGILTGVRPGKLVHKLLDSGMSSTRIPSYLFEKYLVPTDKGKLLTNIVLRQRKLLLPDKSLKEVGVYIGIPFCSSRCSYCSFPSGIVPSDEESQQNFLNLIEEDIHSVIQLLSMHDLHLRSLYIGGGTPTSLGEKTFARLLMLVKPLTAFTDLEEYTVEAGRPDSFSISKVAAMEVAGVNRISVNPQTFHDKTLKLIGRKHSIADFYSAYNMVRNSSIPIVNVDLIIGLPGETEEEIIYSLTQASKLRPNNLTIHTLTQKKSTSIFGKAFNLDAEAAERMVRKGREFSASIGLEPYYLYRQHYMLGNLANVGYAYPGTESLYNIQMMEERHPIIGIGPASASKVPLADGHHLRKLYMPKNIDTYAYSLKYLFKRRAALFDNV